MWPNKLRRLLGVLLLVGVFGIGGSQLFASDQFQPGLIRWVIGNSGTVSSGGSFRLESTSGPPDAGEPLRGGSFQVRGGYWGASRSQTTIYLSRIQR